MPDPATTPGEQPTVAVIILNWNGLTDTLECLQSLRASTYPTVTVWVLDNGSLEDPAPAMADFPEVNLLRSAVNLGFAGGNNHVAAKALKQNPAYLLLLNNDTVVAPDMIAEMVRAHQMAPQAGLVAARHRPYYTPQAPHLLGARWRRHILLNADTFVPADAALPDVVEQDVVYGYALLVPSALVREVGLLEERFFAYWEDVDLSLRARAAGYRNYCAARAVVTHKGAASTSAGKTEPSCTRIYLMCRGLALLVRRHARRTAAIVAPCMLLRNCLSLLLKHVARGDRQGLGLAGLCGYRDGWLGRPPDARWLKPRH